jgi:ATP-dependent RNA helicase RhlE
MTFEALKLTRQFLNAVEDAGYKHPTPIQSKAIPPLRSGQDVIGIAQTGTGKTAAFLLPLLQTLKFAQGDAPRALILAPTKELVIQIHSEAMQFAAYTDLRCIPLFGGIGPKSQLNAVKTGVDLVIATPGRFLEIYLKGGFESKKN